jgi:hypothetical protein
MTQGAIAARLCQTPQRKKALRRNAPQFLALGASLEFARFELFTIAAEQARSPASLREVAQTIKRRE